MAMFRRLATLATAAEAARRYAKKNPEQAAKFVDQAAKFVDKQTKGKYSGQIAGVAGKAKGVAGIRPGHSAADGGYTKGYEHNAGYGTTEAYTAPPTTPQPRPGTTTPGPQAR